MKEATGRLPLIVTALVLSFGLAACADEPQADADGAGESALAQQTDASTPSVSGTVGASAERGEERDGDEHGAEGDGEEHSEEGEESGVQIARGARWIATRDDVRLILSFNSESESFTGRAENSANEPLCVRVEVHLSTGTELGPTETIVVPYGGSAAVTLPAGGEEFAMWSAHTESSPCDGE